MDYGELQARARKDQLSVLGGFHPKQDEGIGATLLLLGPSEPGFWAHFTASPEYRDGDKDPLDRWSSRVVSAIALDVGADAYFPFGGPPYRPFITWAMRTGRAWQSPAGPLVHDEAGMMVSYRGAIALEAHVALPATSASPCETCEKPCLTECPVNALSAETGYDIAACHSFLDTQPDCMRLGCAARRACPVSQGYARLAEQSAFHMRAFHP